MLETPTVAIPENTPGVNVLTMHQSKGLEFPAVIVPVDQSREATPAAIYWDELKPFYINRHLALIQDKLKEILCREGIKGTIDLLNLLYVAFTRAQEALFIPVAVKNAVPPPMAGEKDGLVRRIVKASDVVCRHPELERLAGGTEPLTRGRLDKKPPLTATARPPASRSFQENIDPVMAGSLPCFQENQPGGPARPLGSRARRTRPRPSLPDRRDHHTRGIGPAGARAGGERRLAGKRRRGRCRFPAPRRGFRPPLPRRRSHS